MEGLSLLKAQRRQNPRALTSPTLCRPGRKSLPAWRKAESLAAAGARPASRNCRSGRSANKPAAHRSPRTRKEVSRQGGRAENSCRGWDYWPCKSPSDKHGGPPSGGPPKVPVEGRLARPPSRIFRKKLGSLLPLLSRHNDHRLHARHHRRIRLPRRAIHAHHLPRFRRHQTHAPRHHINPFRIAQ